MAGGGILRDIANTPHPRPPAPPTIAPDIQKIIDDDQPAIHIHIDIPSNDQVYQPQRENKRQHVDVSEVARQCVAEDYSNSENDYYYGVPEGAMHDGTVGVRATWGAACLATPVPKDKRDKRPPDEPLGYDNDTMHKGHLIGRQLGGTSDVINIVPEYERVNTPIIRGLENDIAAALAGNSRKGIPGQKIFLLVKPVYEGASPIPTKILIRAWGSDGFKCIEDVVNVENSTQQASCSRATP